MKVTSHFSSADGYAWAITDITSGNPELKIPEAERLLKMDVKTTVHGKVVRPDQIGPYQDIGNRHL